MNKLSSFCQYQIRALNIVPDLRPISDIRTKTFLKRTILFAGLAESLSDDTVHIIQIFPVQCRELQVMEVITSNLGMPCKLVDSVQIEPSEPQHFSGIL